MTQCPTDQELESLLDERVAPPDAPTRASSLLTHHLEICNRCQERVDELQRDRDFMNEIVSALSDVSERGATTRAETPTSESLSIAGYDIDGELHRGAQGVVFKAHQRSTNRSVALKVLYHESGTSLRMRQRFLREIELAAQLRHPNVVTIFDSGETDDGRLFFAMEFVDGPRLDVHAKALVNEAASRPAEYRGRVLSLFDEICAGVAHAHEHGVVHRDLKPGNILIGRDGSPKVLDFGLAKATDADVNSRFALNTIAGSFMGTIAYASPEQTRGNPDEIDTRSDVYALGVLLHELVTGNLPYDVTGSLADGIQNVLNAEPATPMRWRSAANAAKPIDRDLETIILQALAKDSSRRYQTVAALRADVARYLAGRPIDARRASAVYVAMRTVKRHKGKIAVGLVVAAMIAAITALSSTLSTTQQAAETAADAAELYAQRLAQQEMWDATSGAAREPDPTPAGLAGIDREASVRLHAPQAPKALNPTYTYRGDLFVCELIFERLFWRDAESNLIPNAHLVASIEEDRDPTIKRIRLQPDVTWHDGAPLTASDVVYSWWATRAPAVESARRSQTARIREIVAIDPLHLEIRLASPHATWRISANFEIIPEHRFKPGADEDPSLRTSAYFESLHRNPIGSGPYRFESWGDDEIELGRFEAYRVDGRSPYIGKVVIRWGLSPEEKLAAFLDGGLDLFEMTDEQYRTQKYTDAFEAAGREARRPSSRYHYVLWNCRGMDGLLGNPEVRRALALAINVDRIKEEVTNNLAAACFGPWLLDSPFSAPSLRRFANRPDVARELLNKVLQSSRPAETRTSAAEDGADPALPLRLLVHRENDGDIQTAEIIDACLESIGVEVELNVVESRSEFVRRLRDGEFDACLAATMPAIDPELHNEEFTQGGKLNFGGYSNPKVDALFARAARAVDETERSAIFREIHEILYADQPRTYLYHEPALWAVSRRLSGVVFSSRGPYYIQPGVADWWVADDQQK